MKKLIIILFCLLPLLTQAWDRKSDTTLYLSFSGGMSFSSLKNFADHQKRIGAGFRLYAEYQPTREFSLTGGVALLQKGYRIQAPWRDVFGNSFDTTQTIALDYISLPFSANYNLGRKFNPYIGIGFEANFLISARQFANLPAERNGIAVDPIDVNLYHDGTFKKFELSVFAQGGFEFRLKPNICFFGEYRISTALTKTYNTATIYGDNIKNKAWSVQVGIKWGIPITYKVYSLN